MEDLNSKSYTDGRMQIESYYGNEAGRGTGGGGPTATGVMGMQNLRCYSASYASSANPATTQTQMGNDLKIKKGKSTNNGFSKSWSFNDPEIQRKKRVASYKVYTVEGKVKGSFRKSFRWIKDKCSRVVFGW